MSKSVLRVAGLLALPGVLVAQTSPAIAQSDQVETVVVTSARPPEPVGSGDFSTVTLDQSQLGEADRLDKSLEQVPGLALFRRSTSISANPTIQGASLRDIAPSGAGRALVLLDGIPLNDPFGNWVIWGALPHEDISSAEIVRGAGAGPYGSGALTGTISLDEHGDTDGLAQADASAGSLATVRAGASGGTDVDGIDVFASGAAEHSDGWIPVSEAQRGAADSRTWLNTFSGSVREQEDVDGVFVSTRVAFYDQSQGAGLEGAEARTRGLIGSLTLANATQPSDPGWRVQAWAYDSDLSNTSVAVAADRSATTPANDQYATPALGVGLNAELVGTAGNVHWEAGADVRHDDGESRELYLFSSGAFQDGRRAGGQVLIAGLYGEGSVDWDAWQLTAGVRGDYWATGQGHLLQYALSTGAITMDTHYAGRDGAVPTARVGLKRTFWDNDYIRAAAYSGFRVPSLNEFYRPFRVGNNVTEANATLSPENLYGAEIGFGQDLALFKWDVTGFYNQIHNAVANVTIGTVYCGTTACGILYQRQNAGDVDAVGVEGDASAEVTDTLALRGAFSITDARFQDNAHNLAGKRPAQSPRFVTTAGLAWTPLPDWQFGGDVRWVGAEFEDDLNQYRLGAALVADVRAEWRFRSNLSLVGEIDNVTDVAVNTGETSFQANGEPVISLGAPRTYSVALVYAQ